MPPSNDEPAERVMYLGRGSHPNTRAALSEAPPPPAPPVGNTRTVTHGGHATAATMNLDAEVSDLYEAFAAAAPIRDADGSLPKADAAAVEVAAVALKRWRSVHAWCEDNGRFDEKGAEKAAAGYELRAERALHRALDVLGLNPSSRMKLGLDVARAQSLDLARHWQQQDGAEGGGPDDR